MGYASGEVYTFGSTNFLPLLPILVGWRSCRGGEDNLFSCQDLDGKQWGHDNTGNPPAWIDGGHQLTDQDCLVNGCKGADGILGTNDDSIDGSCTHRIDQGAICHDAADVGRVALPRCSGCGEGSGGCALSANTEQPIIFSCIDYFTTECTYDVTGAGISSWDNKGSYVQAMRAFAQCASVVPEPPGYCHGSLSSAAQLANHEVCSGSETNDQGWRNDQSHGAHADAGGSTTNIGFHIRVPFKVNQAGTYNFRIRKCSSYLCVFFPR